MVPRFPLFAAAMLAVLAAVQPVVAQTPYRDVSRGEILKFQEIKAIADRIVKGRLIGSDYDPASFTYELRYMRGTEIVDVVIDARSGRVLGRRESM